MSTSPIGNISQTFLGAAFTPSLRLPSNGEASIPLSAAMATAFNTLLPTSLDLPERFGLQ